MNSDKGHRSRIVERFSKVGIKGFHDYEILELLLTLIIPRRDTKPIARNLLKEYKSISAVLSSLPKELQQFDGIGERGATLIKFIHELESYCLNEKIIKKEFVSSQKDVTSYLKFNFSNRKTEFVEVLYLDNQNRIISTETVAEGSVDHCSIYPRNIFDRSFSVGASSIIMAHNHPGGSSAPSDADWILTHRIKSAGELLDIELLDHVIIFDSGTVSMRSMGRWGK